MKREIQCSTCGKDSQQRLYSTVYEGEKHKVVIGKNKNDGLVCDYCAKELKVDEEIYAISMWATRSGQPYSPWEKSYLK